MDDLLALDKKNIWHPFTPLEGSAEMPLITGGQGIYLHTSDGRQILDAISSWWVNLHGHANATIANAIADQAKILEQVIFAGFTHEPAVRISENLLQILPPGHRKVFFSDNGSTAVEVALKMAIQYWHNQGIKKKKIIALKGAYHGDTFGSMSVAERGLFTEPFFPYLFEAAFIDFPRPGQEEQTLAQFRAIAESGDAGAFIFEPLVQAAGGMRMYSADILDQLVGYAKERDIICIADEVFTGFGRTGKNFAVDHLTNTPDIIALSKGVTGGFLPLGVTSCNEKILKPFQSAALEKTFFHGHSYTANPLACAAANASFALLQDPACQENIGLITKKHKEFVESLKRHKRVIDARHLGTIAAIELRTAEESAYENSLRSRIYPYFLKRGILLRPLGNVIYLLPPYVIKPAELEMVYDAIRSFVDEIK